MSKAPTESQTHDVDFTREQRWFLHHRVVSMVDATLADGEQPPEWLVDLFDRLDAGDSTVTARQASEMQTELAAYVTDPETPPSDAQVGTAVLEQFPEQLA